MSHHDTMAELLTWTPFLLEGFGWNLLIALVAMLMGTLLGGALAFLRLSGHKGIARSALVLSGFSRNVPTIVFQFYLAVMLPTEWAWPGTEWVLVIPGWVKAAMALSVAVVGFTSDNLVHAISAWRKGDHAAALLFVPSWTSYLLIIVIASSTASIIGVSELLSRCNTVINATGNSAILLPLYLYAGLYFLLFCYPLTLAMRRLRGWMQIKLAQP